MLSLILFLALGKLPAQSISQLKEQLITAKSDTSRARIYNAISTAFSNLDETDSCLSYAQKALNLVNDMQSKGGNNEPPKNIYLKTLYANAVMNIGRSLMNINTTPAIDTFFLAARIFNEINDQQGTATIFQLLGETYANQNNYSNSILYFDKSLKINQTLGNRKNLAYIYYLKALTQRSMSNYGDALENNLTALSMSKENKDTSSILQCLLANGFIYMLVKEYDLALKNQQEALKIATSIHDSEFIATAYSDMGNTNIRAGKLDMAYHDFSTSLAIRRQMGANIYLSSNLLYMSDILIKQGKYQEAIALNLESLQYAKLLKDGRFILDSYSKLADDYQLINDKEKALLYFDSLYQVSTQYGDNIRRAESQYGIAKIYMKENKLSSTIQTLQHALTFVDSNDYKSLTDIYELLASANSKTGNFKEAYLNSLQFKRFSDSAYANEKKVKITSLTNQLEFQNKRALLKASQDNQLAIQQSEIKRQKLVRNITIISLIVSMIIAVVFFKRFREKRKMNEQLGKTLSDLQSTQKQLIQSEKMASLGELTAGIAHEIQNPLNFVNNFSELNGEIIDEALGEIDNGKLEDLLETLKTIKENSGKIQFHGKRAEAIVKGMLHHSRKSTGQKELTDINALCDEYLRLSYHGLRAKDKSFSAKFETHFDPSLQKINIAPQDFGRVILNLINNAFYAVTERKLSGEEGYEPAVIVSTKKLDNKIEISVKDNGKGIPEKIKEKIFQPFFTTKPTGQGTGLGLSLSFDIVKAHGGEIKLESKENEGTAFCIQLPVV